LTVNEHLELWARLKGVDVQQLGGLVRELGLTEKVDSPSKGLVRRIRWLYFPLTTSLQSGGMKRKLSICLALIGGGDVVLLDEPTSGMDP
jgi:ATP-binding cassette subfamily A (ABC1) protein 3